MRDGFKVHGANLNTSHGSLVDKAKEKWPVLGVLMQVLGPELNDYWVLVSYSVLVGIISLAVPIAVQSYVNTVAFGSLFQPIVVLALFLLVVLGFSALFQALNLVVIEVLHRRLFVRFCGRYVSILPNLAKNSRVESLHLSNRFFEVAYFQKSLTSLLIEGFTLLLQTLTGLLLLAFYHPMLLAFDILILIATVIAFYSLGARGTDSAIQESRQKYLIGEWFQDLAHSSSSFRNSSALSYAWRKTDAFTREYLEIREKAFLYPFIQYVGCLLIFAVGSAGLLGVGGYLVMKEQLTLGQLIAAEIVVTAILGSIAKFGGKLSGYYDVLASSKKIADVLLEEPEQIAKEDSPQTESGLVSLKLKSFRNLTAELERGSIRQVVSSDKSGEELAQTLLGDRSAVPGEITWNGVDLELVPPSARTRSVIHLNGPRLIPGTLLENLTLGFEDLDPASIEAAIKMTGSFDLIRSLPLGYQTELSPNDSTLSYEEALRLSLARVILEKPEVFIFTDAPSLLPEAVVQDLTQSLHQKLPETIILVFSKKELVFLKGKQINPVVES